jgi:hypothetical protein
LVPQLSLFGGATEAEEEALRRAASGSPAERAMVQELRSLELDRTTPLDALLLLQRWRERLGGGERA